VRPWNTAERGVQNRGDDGQTGLAQEKRSEKEGGLQPLCLKILLSYIFRCNLNTHSKFWSVLVPSKNPPRFSEHIA